MAYANIFDAPIEGPTISWTVYIKKDGYGGSSTTLDLAKGVKVRFGEMTHDYGKNILPLNVTFEFFDPDLTLWNEMTGSSVDEDDYIWEITDGSNYKWQGYIRMDTLSRRASSTTGTNIIRMVGYDGLTKISKGDPVSTSAQLLPTLIEDAVNNTHPSQAAMDFDIEYVFSYSWTNQSYSGGRYINGIGFNSNVFVKDERGGTYSRKEALEIVLQACNLKLFQSGYNASSLTDYPRWHCVHPWAIGQAVSTSDLEAAYWDGSSVGVPSAAIGNAYANLDDDDIEVDARFYLLKQITDVDVDYDIGLPTTIELVRGGDCNDWTSGVSDYFGDGSPGDSTGLTELASGGSGGGAGNKAIDLTGTGNIIRQRSIWVKKGAKVKATLSFDHKGVGGSPTLGYKVLVNGASLVTPGSVFPTDGAWNTSTINQSAVVISQTERVDIQFQVSNFNGATNCYVDNISLELTDEDDKTLSKWSSRFVFAGSGEVLKWDKWPFENVSMTNPMLLHNDLSTAGAYLQESESSPTAGYDTIGHCAASLRVACQDEDCDLLVGKVYGLYPPERGFTYDSRNWRIASGLTLDLDNEVTEGVWIEKLKVYT